MIRLFISGTGTEVGKTFFSGLLAGRLARAGLRVSYIKPVQTGHPPDDDAATVRAMSGLAPERARLLFSAAEPVAPCFVFENFPFDEVVAAIDAASAAQDCDVLLVESAGGLLVPLDETRFNHHIAEACGLPVLLVAAGQLGCINDALLSAAFLQQRGLPLAGLALNRHFASDERNFQRNLQTLTRLLPGVPTLAFDAETWRPERAGGIFSQVA